MATKPKRGRGRPTKFSDRIAERIFELAEEGRTPTEIAEKLGIARGTLYNWGIERPDFLDTFRKCKNVADELVEMAMFQKATGYQYDTVEVAFDKESGRFVSQEVHVILPPDTQAGKFWLTNRNPKRWSDKQKVEVTTSLADEIKKGRERARSSEDES